MRVKTAQPAKAVCAHADALQIRQHNAAGVADDDVLDITVAIDQDADLAIDFVRCFRELPREFLRDDLARRDAPVVKLFEAVNLIMLESLYVSFDIANSSFLH